MDSLPKEKGNMISLFQEFFVWHYVSLILTVLCLVGTSLLLQKYLINLFILNLVPVSLLLP